MSRLTSSFTCQLISVIITTLIIHHSFTLSLQAQNLPFQQILPTLHFFYLPDCLHDKPLRSTRSSSVVTLSRPPTISLKITDRSFRYASPRLWNQLPDSAPRFFLRSLAQYKFYLYFCICILSVSLAGHVSTHLLIHLSAHLCHRHHSHHPLLPQSFTPGSKPSTNPSHHTSAIRRLPL